MTEPRWSETAAKAGEQREKERRRALAAIPVPDGVTFGVVQKRLVALRLDHRGLAVQTEAGGPFEPWPATEARRGGWPWVIGLGAPGRPTAWVHLRGRAERYRMDQVGTERGLGGGSVFSGSDALDLAALAIGAIMLAIIGPIVAVSRFQAIAIRRRLLKAVAAGTTAP